MVRYAIPFVRCPFVRWSVALPERPDERTNAQRTNEFDKLTMLR